MLKLLRVKIKKLIVKHRWGKLYGYEYEYNQGYIFNCIVRFHTVKLKQILGTDIEIDERVLEAFRKKYGERPTEPYCLCRFEKSWRTICPCIWHIEELAKYGKCRCGLFKVEK